MQATFTTRILMNFSRGPKLYLRYYYSWWTQSQQPLFTVKMVLRNFTGKSGGVGSNFWGLFVTSRLSGSAVGSVAVTAVFISSLYRSSSTFVAAVLGCHPKYFAMSSAVKYLRFCYGKYCPIYKEKRKYINSETYCQSVNVGISSLT